MSGKYSKMPLWAKLLVIAAVLPLGAYTWLLAHSSRGSAAFLVFYPLYVIASAICAWISWPDRREIYWILIILLFLTHAAMFAL